VDKSKKIRELISDFGEIDFARNALVQIIRRGASSIVRRPPVCYCWLAAQRRRDGLA
jgi:hypothetical protein